MTVSGIRGVVGESLDEDFVARFACTHAVSVGARRVVVGRDTRPSGESLARAVCRGIHAAGAEPVDIGIAPTPTTCVATAHLHADAGVILTASHNPTPYNGYKMVHGSGRLCNAEECTATYEAFWRGVPQTASIGSADSPADTVDAAQWHIDRILAAVDVERIRAAAITVAIDSINGAAAIVFPRLLEQLGVAWVGVHSGLDGAFAHNPEPRPEHLGDLAALLRDTPHTWGGFAFDPDADRLAPMGEDGSAISEEMTLALALDRLLSRQTSPVATNLSTSMVIDDVAAKHGVKVFRTKIGEANVVAGMQARGCAYGGEGNGGVIFPAVSTVRDGFAALALILESMAVSGRKLTALCAEWTSYPIVKEKIALDGLEPLRLMDALAGQFAAAGTLDRQDGLKIAVADGWVHLRPSNTEPIMRCYAEARTADGAQALARQVIDAIEAQRTGERA